MPRHLSFQEPYSLLIEHILLLHRYDVLELHLLAHTINGAVKISEIGLGLTSFSMGAALRARNPRNYNLGLGVAN